VRWSQRTRANKSSYSPWGPFCEGVGSSLLNVYPMLAIYQVLATLALIMGFIRQYRSIFHDWWNLYHHDLHSPEPVVVFVHVGRDDSTWDLSLALGIAVICHKCKFESTRNCDVHVIDTLLSIDFPRNGCSATAPVQRSLSNMFTPPLFTIVFLSSLIFKLLSMMVSLNVWMKYVNVLLITL